jgi:hypothetical protein
MLKFEVLDTKNVETISDHGCIECRFFFSLRAVVVTARQITAFAPSVIATVNT